MQAPKLPAMFSLFRQRGPRGFDLPTRYYDAEKEQREERKRSIRVQAKSGSVDHELFRERLHHSWHRERSGSAQLQRLVLIIGMVSVILFFIIKGFGLVRF